MYNVLLIMEPSSIILHIYSLVYTAIYMITQMKMVRIIHSKEVTISISGLRILKVS